MALSQTDITTTIVRNVLGEDDNNIGLLCSSNEINMWSKKKPIRSSLIEISYSNVGKTGSGFYGLSLPAYDGDDSLLTTYLQPTGGASQKFRIGDFRGYNHTAVIPITIGDAPSQIERKERTFNFIFVSSSEHQIAITDFDSDYRLGVKVYEGSSEGGSLIGTASAEDAGGASVTIDLSSANNDYVTIKFCITDYHKSWDGNDMVALYELPRETTSQNQNWIDVELIDEQVTEQVQTFSAIHDPINNRVAIDLETLSYTGTVYMTFLDKDKIAKDNDTFTISSSGTVHTFYHNDNFITGGETHYVRVWLNSDGSGGMDDETSFTAFGGF